MKILPRMSRGSFNMWKIIPRASLCCVFGLVSTKNRALLFLGSCVRKDVMEGATEGFTVVFFFTLHLLANNFSGFFSSLFKVLQIWFEKFILLKAFQQEGELLARHSVEDATFCWNAKTEPSCWVLFLNSQLTAAPMEELGMHWAQRFPFLCNSAQESLAWLGSW